jgi:very-short-patch-repair endonuclease
MGWKVLRFWEHKIETDLGQTIKDIQQAGGKNPKEINCER